MQSFAVVFYLERWLRVQSTIGVVFLLICAAWVALVTASAFPWVAGLAAGLLAVMLCVLVRIPRMGVRYDSETLTVVGAVWSRRILRDSIGYIDRDPGSPWVTWVATAGRTRLTPLTPLWGNRFGWHPPQAGETRRRYLKRVERWARS